MFKDNISMVEFENLGIKLVTDSDDSTPHFKCVLSGDMIPSLQNRQFFMDAVLSNLKQDFIENLFCAEVLSPYYIIHRHLKPNDMSVRVQGYYFPEQDTVALRWKWNDIEKDILDFWGMVSMTITKVDTISKVSGRAVKLWSDIEPKEVSCDYAGIYLTIDKKLSYFSIQSMENVNASTTLDNGDIQLYFTGQHMTVSFKGGEKVTFVVQNVGIKRRKILYMGIYKDFRYHLEPVAKE